MAKLFMVRQGMEKVYFLVRIIIFDFNANYDAQRVSMLAHRLNNLFFLAFQRKRLKSLISLRFNALKDCIVQLF